MPNYLVLIYDDEQKWAEGAPGTEEAMAGHWRFLEQHRDRIVSSHALQPTSTATSVSTTVEGQTQVTDGPYVETKEALGGYYFIEADDFDGAIELAKQIPAPFGYLEVRPEQVFA